MEPKFKVGDRVIDVGIARTRKERNPYATITGIRPLKINPNLLIYDLDFDDDYKRMSRNVDNRNLRLLTKLELALL